MEDPETAIEASERIPIVPVPPPVRPRVGQVSSDALSEPLLSLGQNVLQEAVPRKLRGSERASMLFKRPEPGEAAQIDADGTVRTKIVTEEDIRKHTAEEVFGQAFQESQMSIRDAHPYRIRMAWRIIRQMTAALGILESDQPLATLGFPQDGYASPDEQDAAWNRPHQIPSRRPPTTSMRHWSEQVSNMVEAQGLSQEYHYCEWCRQTKTWIKIPGFGLLPPPIPFSFLASDGTTSARYTTDQDWNLRLYCEAIFEISCCLQVGGPGEHQQENKLGMLGMDEPRVVRGIFPTVYEILTYEELLLSDTADFLANNSLRATKKRILRERGFLPEEINQIMDAVAARIREDQSMDLDTLKALHVHRLEEALQRARESLNMGEETKLLKQLALVQGINRMEDSTVEEDWSAGLDKAASNIKRIEVVETQVARELAPGEEDR